MKICKDCKHQYRADAYGGVWVGCDYYKKLDPVFGTPIYSECSAMRKLDGNCGPDAKFFEPKPIEPPLKFWGIFPFFKP